MKAVRPVVLIAAASVAVFATSVSAQDHQEMVRQDVMKFVDAFARNADKPNSKPTVRELTHWAHAALALGMDPTKAEAYVRRAMALQNTDPASKDYGTVMWQEGHPEIRDPNSIEFTMLPMGPILLRYTDKLSPSFASDMAPHVKAAIAAIRRHRVGVDYTNIYLMKLVNLILLGQAIDDPSAQADGVANLDNWLSSTAKNGITEYDTPTYSQVQLDVLGEGVIYAHSPQVRAKLLAALNYLRSDIAANYFAGRQSLSGPHSRTYQWSTGDGTIDRFYVLSGISDYLSPQGTGKFGSAGLSDATRPLLNVLEGEPPPDDSITNLARVPQRIIQSKFGPKPGDDRYNFITPDFSIGSVSAFYSAHDSELTIELPAPPGQPRLPILSVVSDDQDAPYGAPLLQRDGHRKPQHLKDAMAVVQDHGAILALLDLAPGIKNLSERSVATDVLLPANAQEITLDGQPVAMTNGNVDVPAKIDSVVGVRSGNSAAAVRLFAADGKGGQGGEPATVRLKWDGNEYGFARLVAYHYQGPPRVLGDNPVRAGLLMLARRCDSPEQYHAWLQQVANLPIEQQGDAAQWSATAKPDSATLHTILDLQTQQPAERNINGQPISLSAPLTVNEQAFTPLVP